MMLMTKEIAKKLPALYGNEGKTPSDTKVPLKLFSPVSPATWYVTEYDPETGDMFGWCDLGFGCPELGYVNLNELKQIVLPWGLKIERDRHWDGNTTLQQVMNGERC